MCYDLRISEPQRGPTEAFERCLNYGCTKKLRHFSAPQTSGRVSFNNLGSGWMSEPQRSRFGGLKSLSFFGKHVFLNEFVV